MPSSNNLETGVIDPLAIGNVWIYEYDRYDDSGKFLSSYFDTIMIIKDTTVGGEKLYATKDDPYVYFCNRSDGNYSRRNSDGNMLLWLPYPAKVNDSISRANGEEYVKIESISETVTVKAGVFTTYKYKIYSLQSAGTGPILYSYLYYAPNIGLVKIEPIYNPARTVQISIIRGQLFSFKLY